MTDLTVIVWSSFFLFEVCARFLFINSACYVKRNHNASLFQLFVCKYVASCIIDSPENHLTINKNVEILKNMHLGGGHSELLWYTWLLRQVGLRTLHQWRVSSYCHFGGWWCATWNQPLLSRLTPLAVLFLASLPYRASRGGITDQIRCSPHGGTLGTTLRGNLRPGGLWSARSWSASKYGQTAAPWTSWAKAMSQPHRW